MGDEEAWSPILCLTPVEWGYLPEIVLEKIYMYLKWEHRLRCALVCKHWQNAFYSPMLWRKLLVTPRTFTRRRLLLYGGHQDEISMRRVQSCLTEIGEHLRHIVVLSNSNYFNMSGFIRVLFSFLEYFDEYPMPNLERFEFTFNCENYTPVMGWQISGTGGNILEGLQKLLHNFQGLKHLVYNQLLLNTMDAHGVLEDLLVHNQQTLQYLELVNFTASRYPLFALGRFYALRTLAISPMNLTDDIAMMVSKQTPLQRLIVIQDKYTPPLDLAPVSLAAWWQVKENNPELRVRLCIRGRAPSDIDVMIQENAPVDEVIYQSPYSTTKMQVVLGLTDEYHLYLNTYAMYGLPRKHGQRSFSARADSSLLLLVRECPNLHTLVIRERISTATLLLLAHEGKRLRRLYVRRNAMILRCDWPVSADWSDEFCAWLRHNARDYERTQREVATLLGDPTWTMLTDREFKTLKHP